MDIHINMLIILFLGIGQCVIGVENGTIEPKQAVRVGVILDLASPRGKMAKRYISMAISDFYARNANYQTRLAVSVKDSEEDVVETAFAALELMNNEEVQAIIGPLTSAEAKFVTNLGERAQVPIISFSATSPSLSPTRSPYFIRTCLDDSSQVKALTSIIEAYGWREVVLIYEDTEYGNGLIPHLTDALQEIDTRVSYRSVISPNFNQLEILKQLNQIMARETRVILVHMTASLGTKLFLLAKQAGMMSEGYAWLITDGLSSLLDPLMGTEKLINDSSMHGVLGVKPYLPNSERLQDFKTRWNMSSLDINLFGLWAYDTVWALAMAAELFHQQPNTKASSFNHDMDGRNSSEPFDMRVSKSGPQLLQTLQSVAFEGLSGGFNMNNEGQLKARDFEIINVRRKLGERVIGYWRHSEKILEIRRKLIVWPGHSKVAPKGWVKPVIGRRLKIGFPGAAASFKEIVNIEWDPETDAPTFSGFSYDVFMAALDKLPFAVPHKLIPFMDSSRKVNGNYDDLLYQIKLKKFDAVLADTTITANRSTYVDFTLPYMEAGVSMVVKVKDDKETWNMWIFLKPLSWDLWLTIGFAFIYTGFVVWFLEHYSNVDFRGPPHQQLGTIFWFSFSTLIFAQSEKLKNKWSRFVLVIWLFVMLIFTQSYTASLASMLTVRKSRPAIIDVNELRSNNYYIGYQKACFVKQLLTGQLNFSESRLRPYTSAEECHDAMSKGSKNGGIDAFFDETPFIKLLLSKYCSKYKVVGPTYKSAGIGFAFPLGSPLVSDFNKAILNITQDPNKLKELESKYFEQDGTKCEDSDSKFSSENPSLSVYSFSGLFIITGMVLVSSCFMHLLKFYSNCSASSVKAIHPESSLPSLHARGEFSPNYGDHLHQVETVPVGEEDEFHYIDSGRYVYGCA